MTTTTYVTGTPITKEWLNDVDTAVYDTLPVVSATTNTNTTDIANKAAKGENSDITKLSGIAEPSGGIGIDGYRTGTLYFQWTGYTNNPVIRFRRAEGTRASPTKALNSTLLGQIEFQGHNGTSFVNGAYIRATASGDYSDTNNGAIIDIYNTPNTSITPRRVWRYDEDGSWYSDYSGTVAGSLIINGSLTVGGVPVPGAVYTRNVQYSQIVSATGTSSIPNDDTVPTNTEGTQIATLTITPSSASKKVRLSCSLSVYIYAPAASVEVGVILALFRGSTCVATARVRQQQDSISGNAIGEFAMGIETVDSPASASSQTYTLRAGRFGGGTWYVNGPTTVDHGGVLDNSYLIAEEID